MTYIDSVLGHISKIKYRLHLKKYVLNPLKKKKVGYSHDIYATNAIVSLAGRTLSWVTGIVAR